MSLRVSFQDRYLIETIVSSNDAQTVLAATLPDFDTSGSPIGVDVDILQLLLNNHPDLNPNVNIIHNRKAIGKSYRKTGVGNEYHIGTFKPSSLWEFDANATTLALPLWLLFQNGVTTEQSVANRAKRIIPYTSSSIEVYASIGRELGTESQIIDACIVDSISLSVAENTTLKANVNFVGAAYRNDVDGSNWNVGYTPRDPLLWQNASVTLRYNLTDGIKLTLDNFNLNIKNNARIKQYGSQNIDKFILGDFEASGSMNISRDIINYEGNQVIEDLLDTANDIGINRLMFVMWGGVESGGGSSIVDTGGVAGTNTIVVTDISNFLIDDIVILDIGNTNQEFGIISDIDVDDLILTFQDKFVYTHALGSGSVREAGRDFFGIKLNIRFDTAPTGGADEISTLASFTCVNDGTYEAIMIGLIDNVNRGIS